MLERLQFGECAVRITALLAQQGMAQAQSAGSGLMLQCDFEVRERLRPSVANLH